MKNDAQMRCFPLFWIAALLHICLMVWLRKKLCVLCLWCLTPVAFSQGLSFLPMVIPHQLGAYARQPMGKAAIILLPAAVEEKNEPAVFASGENRYMLKELTYVHAGAVLPAGKNAVIKGLLQFRQLPWLAEGNAAIGYALQLDRTLSAGLRLGFARARFIGERPIGSLSVEGGLRHHISQQVTWSMHLNWAIPINGAKPPTLGTRQFVFGMGYLVQEGILLVQEFIHQWDRNINSRTGIWWKTPKAIAFFGGLCLPQGEPFLQATKGIGKQEISIGFTSHAQLGLSGGLQYAVVF